MNAHLTGMAGVYLVAAELAKRGFIASPTSRSAQGADLLVTNIDCSRTYAVQVKSNAKTFNFWLMNKGSESYHSPSYIYAFVNFKKDTTDFFLVPSKIVAKNVHISKATRTRKSTWYSFGIAHAERYRDNWKIFK